MNTVKRKKYELQASIHTVSTKSTGIIEEVQEGVSQCISSSSRKTKQGIITTAKVNPNKLGGNLFTYEDFEWAMEIIMASAGVEDYTFCRADLRFDSYEQEHFKEFAKLNKLLLSLLGVTYQVRNCYKSENLFSQKLLSISIRNDYFEVENYDKFEESQGADPAMARLELRSKKLETKDLRTEFLKRWFDRLDKASKNFELVQKTYNDELERIYNENKDAYPVKFRSLTDFIIQYQDSIFCKAQLVDLLTRLGVTNPMKRVENHKNRYGLEFFSNNDIKYAINEIKRATEVFFQN